MSICIYMYVFACVQLSKQAYHGPACLLPLCL